MTPDVPVCGRFAPSPSGRMHLGNVFCALLAWLAARAAGGRIVLRMEDLDPARCRPEYAALLEDDLLWLGLDWDEGGSGGGPHEPYFQSACGAVYDEAFARLCRTGQIYPCFCSRADLHAADAPHLSDGTVLYAGRCRALTPEQQAQLAAGRAPAMRLAVPDEVIGFSDGLLGPLQQDLRRECGDFIVRRSDGVYAYQLAVVVDDARMGVNQIVRGRDLASSTPRQILLQRMLGLSQPQYFHVPLLCAPDGRRLSKREKDLDMGALRARCSPRRLTGLLGSLAGLCPAGAELSPQELCALFSWEKIPRRDIIVGPLDL